MRPVLLEMEAFGAFRDRTTVSFADADYFALVGPTGAGKSTVIDGLTFALYGTVPRWDDRRGVGLALTPTANRGVVRLVFDVKGERYVAARELRRMASGNVTQKNVRLERLLDASSLGGPEDDVDPVAADGEVTEAVERLLGLPFGHFVKCVVLPQGDFADFLHARPAERQKVLVRLLGLDVYERLARAANSEAARQRQRVEWLDESAASYADVTGAAEQAAADRVAQLEALKAHVDVILTGLRALIAERSVVDGHRSELAGQRDRLAALTVPPGLSDLDGRRRTAASEHHGAERAATAAREAAESARRDRAAAPPLEPLLERVRKWGAHDAETARLPGLVVAAERASAVARSASTAARDASDLATVRASEHERAVTADDAARERHAQIEAEVARLVALRVPDDVADLDVLAATGGRDLTATSERLRSAEAADVAARDALAAAPARAPLERARQALLELAELRGRAPGLDQAERSAAEAVDQARADLTAAEADRAEARSAQERSHRHDLAATLRPGLAVGTLCPVCEQPVTTLPPPLEPAAAVAAADQLVAAAVDAVRGAQDRVGQAVRRHGQTQAASITVTQRIEAVTASLATVLPTVPGSTVADLTAALTRVDVLERAVSEAAAEVVAARRARDAAAERVDQVGRRVAESRRALHAARDPLVALGAPDVEHDAIGPAWSSLLDWAARSAESRQADRSDAVAGRVRTQQARAEAAAVLTAAREESAAAARTSGVATRAEADADADLRIARDQIAFLARQLAGGPDRATATAELEHVRGLEQAVLGTAAARADAEDRLRAAVTAARALELEVADAASRLTAARDPVVPIGAPAVDLTDPVTGWGTLAAWAAEAAQRLDRDLDSVLGTVAQADARIASAQAQVRDALESHGVGGDLLAGPTLADQAGQATAAALTAAHGAFDRVRERREELTSLQRQRHRAEEARQVAHELGLQLRSDAFPRWLVSAALDVLVADASATLVQMSGGQFDLVHEDGSFVVVDHADADSRRPVRTLSGGETFQASLSLALALSAHIGGLAAEGAAGLDSIFLDEGFGTLDEATLDVVASTLENLASSGQRMVGLVTHVPALAERVPVRFRVSRTGRSSTVQREEL